ncbi:hypothetical protein CDD82_5925 [Ophiocordyceps australis]|uniref:Uncharacterized protein n=1 Tax=Ophiocordyceps australis TaxID=1399860 RepID=A0A2C5YSN3_9HYPO|nr:hypothetical protein CDD82_5925 [Ophiocordyceps australis]
MCTYDLNVVLCGCRDPACKQRDAELDQWLTEPGHVLEVCWYYRISGLCLGSFYNHDPNRLVVRLGMNPRNGNSTQDCTNKKIDFDEPCERWPTRCPLCVLKCRAMEGDTAWN